MISIGHYVERERRLLWLFMGLALGLGGMMGLLIAAGLHPLTPFLVAGGLLVSIAMFMRPEWGLLALVFIAYTRLSDVLVHYHGLPSVFQPFMLLLVLTVIIRSWLYGELPRGWLSAAMLLGLYGFVGFSSLLYAADGMAAQTAFITYLKDVIIALVVMLLLQRPVDFRRVVWVLLLAGIFLGTITTFQHLTGTFTNPYGGFADADLQHIIGATNDYRIAGPVGDPNFYGQILVILLPLALDRFWNERSRFLRLLAAWALVVCLLSIVFTFSRGAFVATVLVLAFMLLHHPPRPVTVLLTIAIALPLLQFVPAEYTERVRTIPDAVLGFSGRMTGDISLRGRTSEITVGWLMFADHPVQGVGLDNYPHYYQEYSRSLGLDQRRGERHAHSLYLQIASEMGILGLTAFALILWYLMKGLRDGRRNFLKAGMTDYASMVSALGIGIAGYLIAALFLHGAFPRYLWLLLGIGFSVPQVARHQLVQLQARTRVAARQQPMRPKAMAAQVRGNQS